MRFKGFLLFISGAFLSYKAAAQNASDLTQSRILILLDESSSMLNEWAGGRPKHKVAQELILNLMDSVYAVNPNVEFSLRVFGNQSTVPENDCHDTRNEVPFGKDNRQRMELRLDDLKPLGVTSIAYSLKQAALQDLVAIEQNAYSIILVTDGGESCGGNICDVMRMLIKNKVYFRPYIVGLEDVPGLAKEYECMGDYLQVTKKGDIPKAIGIIVEAFRPMIKITKTAYKEIQETPRVEEVKKPEPPKVEAPKVEAPAAPAREKIEELPQAGLMAVARRPRAAELAYRTVPALELPSLPPPVAEEPAPAKPAPDNIARLTPAKTRSLIIAAAAAQKLGIASVPAMPEVAVEAEPVKPAPENITRITPARIVQVGMAAPKTAKLRTVSNIPELPVAEPEPVKPEPVSITRISASGLTAVKMAAPAPKKQQLVTKLPALPEVAIEFEKPAPDNIARLTPSKMRQFSIMWVMDDRGLQPRKVPALPPVKLEIPKVATTPTPGLPALPPTAKQMEFTATAEDAKETTVQVYFTDGKGKFYTSTPQIVLMDRAKKKAVKQFFRTVDANGNPDPQPDIPVGSYDLTFTNKPNFVVPNVTVEANKRNIITVKLPKPTLSFVYAEPGDFSRVSSRPVSEFKAVVIERNKAQGRVQNQKCTEQLEYEPGNYHVEINTFPQDIRNIDLDFDEKVITIPQPGFVKFTPSEDGQRSVTIYQRMGDRFLNFYTMNLADPRSKHLNLQPGDYQAHYQKGPNVGSASEKVKLFVVRATQETEVNLD